MLNCISDQILTCDVAKTNLAKTSKEVEVATNFKYAWTAQLIEVHTSFCWAINILFKNKNFEHRLNIGLLIFISKSDIITAYIFF